VYDLALIIVDQCSRVFFDRSRPLGLQPNLVDIFADAIRGVVRSLPRHKELFLNRLQTYRQTAAFDQFLTYTHIASADYNSREKSRPSSNYQNTLLNINPEGNLLKEVKDILDELHILTRIQTQQQGVAETFVRNIRHILLSRIEPECDSRQGGATISTFTQVDLQHAEECEATKLTLTRANNLLAAIESRISELNTLKEYAMNTSASLKDLLTLKQQQSGIFEAREAVKQASETLKQGRSIMLFTVITIIFVSIHVLAA
jgi:BMFP domain-containing protein YqiC